MAHELVVPDGIKANIDGIVGGTTPAAITGTTVIGTNIDGIIGANTPAAGAFTTLIASTPIAVASGGSGTTGDSIVKAWIQWAQAASHTITDSFNVSSITDVGAGQTGLNWDTDFANDDYALSVWGAQVTKYGGSIAVGTVTALFINLAGNPTDSSVCFAIAIGDQ